MIIESARLAAQQLLEPKSRSVVLKSVGLTILLFFGVWLGLDMVASSLLAPWLAGWPWVTTAIAWFLGAGVLIGAGFMLAPATAIFAGLFLDDVAEHVETHNYPNEPVGRALPLGPSIWLAIKFTILVIGANLLALLLVLLPGINFAIFFVLNGYLLGREYFQFAAMRYNSEREAHDIRKQHSLSIFLAGLIIACFMAVPLVNLFTPVFAASLMVHLHKRVSRGSEMEATTV